MKKSRAGVSILESIIVMMILTVGIIGAYDVYQKSTLLVQDTKEKIQAIQIAREGIEAMIVIRNTNWSNFSSNYRDCWNIRNYNNACIVNPALLANEYLSPGSYRVYTDADFRWIVDQYAGAGVDIFDADYKSFFEVFEDTNGLYTQDPSAGGVSLLPNYTREIVISYPEDTNTDTFFDHNDDKMNIISRVMRPEGQSVTAGYQQIELDTTLTNWKDKNF